MSKNLYTLSFTGIKFFSLFQSLKRSEIIRNTSILVSGTALAQIIPILLQPVLRRFFSPEVFGAYSVFLSLVGILAIIASFKYDLAIVLPSHDKESVNIVFLTFFVNLSFCIFLLILVLLFNKGMLQFLNLSEEFGFYLYLVPASIFFYNIYQSLNNWLVRQKKFVAITVNKFVRRGTEGFFQVIFTLLKQPWGLVAGDLAGHAGNLISGFYQSGRSGLKFSFVSPAKLRYVALKYSEFPRFNLIPSFMSACSFLLPAILINKFFSAENTGYFDLSKLLLSVPLALISTSLSNVLLQSMSEKFRKNESMITDIKHVLFIVMVICAGEILIIQFFGVLLFKILFGAEWAYSGEISKILVWSYSLNFIVGSFSAVLISFRKIRLLSLWQIFYFFAILSLILFRTMSFGDFIKIYVCIEVFCYVIMISIIISVVSGYEQRLAIHNNE